LEFTLAWSSQDAKEEADRVGRLGLYVELDDHDDVSPRQ
jgi:hypothetical protein